ncbi:SgcJ/EcaC family oxidoreductase [Micromonospora sp. NPDC126480]|uniref:SgcJ/EcaC family oxidoreductase n=1 Tax=Micromonospora sp. NPDC126480 TaxID=3155312 RepID=UPI003319E580
MPDDRTAVLAVIDALVAAWGRQDAEAYGRLFTADATYVTWVGTHYRGRRDIVASHQELFTKFVKGTRLADEVLDVRFLGPDAAVVTGRGEIYKGDRPRRLTKVQTYVLVREDDGRWRIAAFQNTKRKPLMEAVSFRFARGLVPTGAGIDR